MVYIQFVANRVRFALRLLSPVRPAEPLLQTGIHIAGAMRSLYGFKPRVLTPLRCEVAGVASRPAWSSVAERADDVKVRALTRPGMAAPCLKTLRLAQVSSIAHPRPRRVLLCVPAPCLSSWRSLTPDCTPWVAGAYLTLPWDLFSYGCQAAACGGSMAERRSSRRPPVVLHRGCTGAWEGPVRGPDDG